MKKFRKLSLVLAMSLVFTQMPLTGPVFTWAEPADESVSGTEAGRQDAENSEEAAKESDGKEKEEAAKETVSTQEEAAQETVSGQKEEKAAEEEPATGTVSTQDEEAASGNSVSSDAAETEEAAGEDANMVNATIWEEVQEAFNNHKNVTLSGDIKSGGTPLTVSKDTTVTLDLNGHTINRDAESNPGEFGSAIRIEEKGNLTLTDSKGSGTITGGINDSGGGVYVWMGTFTMSGGNITGNKATIGGGGVSVFGGTFTMTGGKIENNEAYQKDPTTGKEYGDGGGVRVIDKSTFTMKGGEICNNKAVQAGGGVYLQGTDGPVSFNMIDGLIQDNTVYDGWGGGIYAKSNGVTVSLNMAGGSIYNNVGGIEDGINPGYGGGIYLTSESSGKTYFTMTDGSISHNTVIDGNGKGGFGGGIYSETNGKGCWTLVNMIGGIIEGNTAGEWGGGVYMYNSGFTMDGDSIIDGNHAKNGGGIYVDGNVGGASLSMNNGEILNNTAKEWGGGVYMINSEFTMDGGSINHNAAGNGGNSGYGGGIYVHGNDGSASLSMNGGQICDNTSNGGGGIHLGSENSGKAFFYMTGGSISNNHARRNNDGGGHGGGIHSTTNGEGTWTLVNMTGGSIEGNDADKWGGGVYMRNSGFTMADGTINKNTAGNGDNTGYGGGIYIHGNGGGATFTLEKGAIESNKATKNGGGVYALSEKNAFADFIMNGGDIRYNDAAEHGGGIASGVNQHCWTRLLLNNGNISQNSAKRGGGLYTNWNISMLKNVNIRNNTASENGGGAYIDGGQLTVSGGSIDHNTAGIKGGGIYEKFLDAAEFNISGDLAINENTADGAQSNVVMADGGVVDSKFKINVKGKLDNSTRIGIKSIDAESGNLKNAVLTSGLKGNGLSENFVAEGKGTLSVNAAGEIEYIVPCTHDGGYTIVGAKEANCTEKGSTGEKHCNKCGALIESAKEIPINPDNHDYNEGKVTKPASRYVTGETTYTCNRCGHKKTLANIPCTEEDETSEDKKERDEDTMGADGKPGVESKTVTDEKTGEETETVSVQGKEVSKIVTDPESGKETVESLIWIGGLSGNYTYTGSAIKPSFRVYDGMKKLTEKTDYTVAYSANKDAGTANITVKFKGNYQGTDPIETSFTIDPAKLGVDVVAHDLGVAKKKSAQNPVPVLTFAATGKTVNKKNYEVSYDKEVKDAGNYIANIRANNGNFNESTTALVKVTDKNHLLENAKVTFNPSSYAYTGKEIVPDQSKITVKLGSNTLVMGRDVRIASIHNNILPGTATVILEAISSNQAGYAGSKTATFKIKGSREIKDVEITVEKSVPFAKGGAKPSVTVKDGDTVLKSGTDYTLSYKKNKAVTSGETAEVIIKGKGSYKGSVTKTFAIKKQNLNEIKDCITAEDQFTVKSKLKKAVVTIIDIDGKKLAVNKDYTVGAVDTDSDPANSEVSGNAFVKVTGTGNYEGEVKVAFCYKEASADLSKTKAMKIADQAFTGGQVKLSAKDLENILYTGSKSSPSYLKFGEDFEVKVNGYSNNVKKGTAKVTLKGKGKFAGKKTVSFKIKEKKGSYQGSLVGGEWK